MSAWSITEPTPRQKWVAGTLVVLYAVITIIPLIWRGNPSAHANTLGGVMMNDWDSEIWNIKDWYRMDG